MNQHDETKSGERSGATNMPISGRGPRWARKGIVIALLGTLAVAGVALAANSETCREHMGMGMHGHMDPAMMSEHVDHLVNHMLADGTPEQKAKVSAILKTALNDLKPLHAQHKAAHDQVLKLLTQSTVDRVALEQVRVSEMQLADQVSKRITLAVEDAADVLTPEQRVKLADHLKKRMG